MRWRPWRHGPRYWRSAGATTASRSVGPAAGCLGRGVPAVQGPTGPRRGGPWCWGGSSGKSQLPRPCSPPSPRSLPRHRRPATRPRRPSGPTRWPGTGAAGRAGGAPSRPRTARGAGDPRHGPGAARLAGQRGLRRHWDAAGPGTRRRLAAAVSAERAGWSRLARQRPSGGRGGRGDRRPAGPDTPGGRLFSRRAGPAEPAAGRRERAGAARVAGQPLVVALRSGAGTESSAGTRTGGARSRDRDAERDLASTTLASARRSGPGAVRPRAPDRRPPGPGPLRPARRARRLVAAGRRGDRRADRRRPRPGRAAPPGDVETPWLGLEQADRLADAGADLVLVTGRPDGDPGAGRPADRPGPGGATGWPTPGRADRPGVGGRSPPCGTACAG